MCTYGHYLINVKLIYMVCVCLTYRACTCTLALYCRVFPNFWSNSHLMCKGQETVYAPIHCMSPCQGTCKGTTPPLKLRMNFSIYSVEGGTAESLSIAFLDVRSYNSSINVINNSNSANDSPRNENLNLLVHIKFLNFIIFIHVYIIYTCTKCIYLYI